MTTTSTFGDIEQHQHQVLAHQQILSNKSNAIIDGLQNDADLLQMPAGKVDNKTFNLKQVMVQEDLNKFVVSMRSEMNVTVNGTHWKVVRHSDFGFPPVIKAIWPFKRKIIPSGEIIKHKARTSARGRM